ncbi:hypothetical protein DIC66_08410 [Rhodoferax lacus]|uniref:DUF883 domain-containing protein n=1 Tax=Rhodoferax lacus TaxID=2184758 RepID=A0A3E1RCR2_9BURK|nr:hypothetical protein [Rhodoferax lacus]RFO97156.1 hypothetical protein DIC66_08410 [Rhodoferax lacus]
MTELNSSLDSAAHKAYAASADTLRPVVDHLLSGMHQAVERLADVAASAVDRAAQSGEYLKDTQAQAVRGARGYVREKPLTSVGVAVATGFLLSWALRQR